MELSLVYKSEPEWKEWESQLSFEEVYSIGVIVIQDKDSLVGQVIIYENPFHLIEDKKTISLGNISIQDDSKIFEQVHAMTIEVAKKLKAKHIISPMNGSTWNNYRFVSFQSKSPFLLEPLTEPYYINNFKQLAYKTLASYFSQEADELVDNWEKCEDRYQYFIDQGISFEPFNIENAEKEFRSLASFCNASFRKNFLFSPIKEEDFVQKMMQIVPLINPAFTLIARSDEKIRGFVFAYQDMLNNEKKSIIVKTLARDLEGPFGGMGSVLSALVMKAAIAENFNHSIHALMIDHNASTTISSNFKGKILSRYELLYYTL